MTDQQILEKAIQKAIDGGFKFFPEGELKVQDSSDLDGIVFEFNTWPPHWTVPLSVIIFNHDFAKALWGEEPYSDNKTVNVSLKGGIVTEHKFSTEPAWQYHLQQMVIAKDPIKYLGENI